MKSNNFKGKLWQYRKKRRLFEQVECILNNHLLIKIGADQVSKSLRIENAFLHKYNPDYEIMCPYPYYFTLQINGKTKTFGSTNKQEIDEWYNMLQKWCLLKGIFKDFEFIKKIGESYTSSVMKLKCKKSGKFYAGKIIPITKQTILNNILAKEIKINRDLDHPYIPRYHTAYLEDESICMIFDLIEGPNLLSFLKTNGILKEDKALIIMRALLRVLVYLKSKNIIHNDIKLNNILMASDESITDIRLIDFGISTYIHEVEVSPICCGTIGFIAPEILKGQRYDYKVDIFGAGIIFYSMLTGKFPFKMKKLDQNELLKLNQKCEIDFPEYLWDKISKETRNLVNIMLLENPLLRINAQKALYICCLNLESTQSNESILSLQKSTCQDSGKLIRSGDIPSRIESIYKSKSQISKNIETGDQETVELDVMDHGIFIKLKDYIMDIKTKPQ